MLMEDEAKTIHGCKMRMPPIDKIDGTKEADRSSR